MEVNFGDIMLVSFEPSLGKEYKKTRPALVVQSKNTIEKSPLITVVPITSKLEKFRSPDVFIEADGKNRLLKDSLVKVQYVSSFDRKRFIKKIGEANSPTLRKVRGYLRKHFNFSS